MSWQIFPTKRMSKNQNNKAVALKGTAIYEENSYFSFTPKQTVAGTVQRFSQYGVAHQLSSGAFHFEMRPRYRSQSKLIKKVAHGRLSATKDNATLLTLKVYEEEGLDVETVMLKEVMEVFQR